MLKLNDRTIPGIEVMRPDKTVAALAVYTPEDEALVASSPDGGLGTPTLEQIAKAKEALALDAADGRLDFTVGTLALERPSHTIFWSNNSAANLFRALAAGQRTLRVDGKDVVVTPAFRSWVESTMFLESVPGAPVGG